MKKVTRRDTLKLGVGATAGLIGIGIPSTRSKAADPIVMKLATDVPLGHPFNIGFQAWAEQIENGTEGRVKATIFPDAQLGGEEDMTNGLKIGAVDGMFSSPGVITPYVPEVGVVDLPFLFRDIDHLIRATNGPFAATYQAQIEDAIGAEILGWRTVGSRDMWNNRRPIKVPADVEGLKMRTQTSRIQQAIYLSLGALPTPIPFVEIYTSVQTGVVDGADVGMADILAVKFYEVARYMSLTRHVYIAVPLYVSRKFLAKLTPHDQDVVQETGLNVLDIMQDNVKQQDAEGREFLSKAGMQITEEVDREAFAEKTDVVILENAKDLGGMELIEAMRAA